MIPTVADPSESSEYLWEASPWCDHKKCYSAFTRTYNNSYEQMCNQNKNWKSHWQSRRWNSAGVKLGITKPFLVCKKMHIEASESLYSTMTFIFGNMAVLRQCSC